jgi:hypothetical protein
MTDHEFKAPERTSNEAEWLQAIRRELADFTIHNGGSLGLCEVSVTDRDGSARPCERDVFGYSWYEGGEHEPLLSMTCVEHSNEAGGLIAGLYWTAYDLLERATRLTVERGRERGLAARLEAQVARVAEAVCEPHECAIWHLRDELDGMSPDAEVTRIEWRYLDGVSE